MMKSKIEWNEYVDTQEWKDLSDEEKSKQIAQHLANRNQGLC